jgi:hypothetical protein
MLLLLKKAKISPQSGKTELELFWNDFCRPNLAKNLMAFDEFFED